MSENEIVYPNSKQVIEVKVNRSELEVEERTKREMTEKQLFEAQEKIKVLEEQLQNQPQQPQKQPQGQVKNFTAGGKPLDGSNGQIGYETCQDMVEDLQLKERLGDPTAKAVLDELFLKMFKNVKEGKTTLNLGKYDENNEGIVNRTNRLYRAEMLKRRGM